MTARFDFSKTFDAGTLEAVVDAREALAQIDQELAEIDSQIARLALADEDDSRLVRTRSALGYRLRYKKAIQARLGLLKRQEADANRELNERRINDPELQERRRLREARLASVDHMFVKVAEEQLDRFDFDEMMEEARDRAKAADAGRGINGVAQDEP